MTGRHLRVDMAFLYIWCLLFGAGVLFGQDTIDIQPALSSAQEASLDADASSGDDEAEQESYSVFDDAAERRIRSIIVVGNKHVSQQALVNRIPYQIGEIFDQNKTARLIRNLYFDLKRFKQIEVKAVPVDTDKLDLYIIVTEKPTLKEVRFVGNSIISEAEIKKIIDFDAIPAIDEHELARHALAIKKMYEHKGYYGTTITSTLELDAQERATAIFTVQEAPRSSVRRVRFDGNNAFTAKTLRTLLYTKEDWLLGFMDGSGIYEPERVEADKQALEQFYQNKGYINAKILDVTKSVDLDTGAIDLLFDIQEGPRAFVKEIKALGNEILSDDFLTAILPLRVGMPYSRELLIECIKQLEYAWGSYGYIFAHIDPAVESDDQANTVSIVFHSDPGKPVYLNRLNIRGNRKTRDKVIRRNIPVQEGFLVTKNLMELGKTRVEGLGFFEQRDGVNWKIMRLSDDQADLDLIVKEAKTGSAHIKFGFGGSATDMSTPGGGFNAELNVSDTNWCGLGIKGSLVGSLGTNSKTVELSLAQPWLFDRPVYGSLDLYYKRLGYDQVKLTTAINEKHAGGNVVSGFMLNAPYPALQDTFIRFGMTVDNVRYEHMPVAQIFGLGLTEAQRLEANAAYNTILCLEFQPSTYASINMQAGQDTRNHPLHPSRGHTWVVQAQSAVPSIRNFSGFQKFDFDAIWFTPLINERDLVFKLHTYAGLILPFGNKEIPYRELFHIGGPATVRGYLFGEIGPSFTVTNEGRSRSDSIGGLKAIFVNAEVIFPITPDFTMKGVLFYDGGAGWDNPHAHCVPSKYITNNNFDFRQAVGLGLRILNPMPMRIDWGFKLDPRQGESSHEVHFGMTYDW